MTAKSPYIVGIGGGSGSGKTYLLNQLAQRFSPDLLSIISQDNYYKSESDCEFLRDEEGVINYDHPDSVDLDRLVEDIVKLQAGVSIQVKEYIFHASNKEAQTLTFHPTPLILVEGIFTLCHPPLTNLFSLTLFLDAMEEVRLERRLTRDLRERGYDRTQIMEMYEKYVSPMYQQFVEPMKLESDLIIPNNKDMGKAVEVITHHLEKAVGKNYYLY
ncbi:MAG: uridine kinase [Bacteroidota bacterium]